MKAAHTDIGVRFAECIRAHGVTNFPDPSGGGGIRIPDDINPLSPAFKRAQRACQSLMPGGAIGHATEQDKQAMLHTAQCMRAYGITGFPDPVTTPPSNPVGLAFAFGRPGAFIVVPDSVAPQSPRFKQAAKACQFPGA